MPRPALSAFRRLTRHFVSGLVDQDLIASGEDLHTTFAGLLAAFLVFSAGLALLFLGKYNSVTMPAHGRFRPAQYQTLADKLGMAIDDKTLLLAGVMLVMALVTILFWDSLALDDRDVAVLGPLPVRPGMALLAKGAAATLAAAIVAVALNALPSVLFPIVVLAKAPVGLLYVSRAIAAHALAGIAACAFVYLVLFTLRSALGLLRPGVTRRLLPLLQCLFVLALVSLILALPLLAPRASPALGELSPSVFLVPPLWFLGLEEVLIGRPEQVFIDLAQLALRALGLSFAAACIVQVVTLRVRSQRAALQAGSPTSALGQVVAAFVGWMARLVAKDGRARASFLFTAYALTRSPRHRLYLAASLGVGVAVAGATVGAVHAGVGLGPLSLSLTTMGLAGQLNVIFFLVVGMRMAMTLPADLEAGWIFRFHATAALQRHLAGTRGAIFFLILLPVLVLLAPLHALLWGGYVAVVHFAFGVVAALALLEVVFTGYTRLPFVSAFTPGRTLLSPRFALYLLGYLLFVYLTPGLEQLLVTRTAMFYAWVAMFAVLVARFITSLSARSRRDQLAAFDEPDERVQQLGLAYTLRDEPSSARVPATATSEQRGLFGMIVGARRRAPRGNPLGWVWSAGQLHREVAHAVRRLRANPGFTLFSVVTLALGIGVTTAVYSVVYSSVLRPLQVQDLDRVLNLYHWDPREVARRYYTSLSQLDFEDLRATQTTFSEVAAHAPFRQVVVANGTGERAVGEMVSGGYFSVLGIQPALGRFLNAADDRTGALPVAVIGNRTWHLRFQGRPDVVGQTLMMGGHSFVIVGVAPPDFRGVELPNLAPTTIWIPLAAAALVRPGELERDRESRHLLAKGRIAPGRTIEEGQTELRVIGQRLDQSHPIGRALPWQLRSPQDVSRRWTALPARDRLIMAEADPGMRWVARLLMTAVGLVLLVACTNVANLSLARGTARRRELAVRLALGASRWQLTREQLVESTIVAALSALTACGAAWALVRSGGTTLQLGQWFSVEVVPRLEWPVAMTGLAATVLALLIFGLIPALQLTRSGLSIVNAGEGGSGVSKRWRGRRWLIAAQVAVSVALVALASLSVQQIARAANRDTGFDLNQMALVRFDFALHNWPEERARRALEKIRAQAAQHGSIDAVTIASGLPAVSSGRLGASLTVPERPFAVTGHLGRRFHVLTATPEIFTTLGVPLVRGRPFGDQDREGSGLVIILSEMAAQELFGRRDVIGRQVLRRGPWSGQGRPIVVEALIVVGVAADTDRGRLGERREGFAYVPFAQQYDPSIAVIARASGDPAAALATLKAVVNSTEPELGVVESGTGRELGSVENLAFDITAALAGLLGMLALILAMIGLYGVLSYVVAQRTHEMGVRVALGAREPQIMRLVLWDGLRPVVEGLIVGFVLGDLAVMAMRPAFARPLPEIDATLLTIVPALFLAAALVACYVPSRRAARVPPSVALREG